MTRSRALRARSAHATPTPLAPERSRRLRARHPREVLPFAREVARADADVVRGVLGLDPLHVLDLPLAAEGERLLPYARRY